MAIHTWRRIESFQPANAYPGRAAAPAADPIWEWERLTPKDREGALSELSDWINNVLVNRYRLGHRLPACWAKHSDLVAVLVWLHESAPELRERNAALVELDSDWEAELRSVSSAWPSHCREHDRGPIGNPKPALSGSLDFRPRLLLLDHCLRVMEQSLKRSGAEIDQATAEELEKVLARAGVSLGQLRGRRKAEVRMEISDLVLDLARETLAQ